MQNNKVMASGGAPSTATVAAMECPRCGSSNTKFCYYNNYSSSQPRYLCKACRRYWTHGGSLRNVPVGGASRSRSRRNNTNRRPSVSSSSSAVAANAMLQVPSCGAADTVGLGGFHMNYSMAMAFASSAMAPGPGGGTFLSRGGFPFLDGSNDLLYGANYNAVTVNATAAMPLPASAFGQNYLMMHQHGLGAGATAAQGQGVVDAGEEEGGGGGVTHDANKSMQQHY